MTRTFLLNLLTNTLTPATDSIVVIPADLEIYKPRVVDPAEPMIAKADELTTDSVAFVNLDNDDNEAKFDHGGATTDDEVTGADDDDELVKIKLKLKPSSWKEGQVKLLATAGAGNIAVWRNNNKAASSAYILGTALNVPGDFTVEGDSLVKTMWVEGISAHTAQQGTKLRVEYTSSGTTCDDEVALTVVRVDQITWTGKGNRRNDDDALDADPNWPGGLTPNALRVFPDARVVSGSVEANPRDKVTAEVMLTVEPPHPIQNLSIRRIRPLTPHRWMTKPTTRTIAARLRQRRVSLPASRAVGWSSSGPGFRPKTSGRRSTKSVFHWLTRTGCTSYSRQSHGPSSALSPLPAPSAP